MVNVTLLELVGAVTDAASSEAEVIATVAHLVNSGAVRLRGNFRGARIDLGDTSTPRANLAGALNAACMAEW
jgi:hypothetical protein